MKKQLTDLLKLQEVGDKNIFCFYDNRGKNHYMFHCLTFPIYWGKSATRKKGEAKTMIAR